MKTVWNVVTELPVTFKVKITTSIFDLQNRSLLEYGNSKPNSRRLVLIDSDVFYTKAKTIKKYFDYHKIDTKIISIDLSEEKKNLENLLFILDAMENFAILRRSEPLICIGGGVLLDMAGLAASLYRRGVPYIKVPTTLLSLIDASIGAKTAINHFSRRNRLGTYYAPVAAYLDKTFLKTLPEEEITSALGEIIKMAVVKNAKLFELLENGIEKQIENKFLADGIADEIISISIDDMIAELEPNLWETDLKRLVDFGHSFSPLLEMKSLDDSNVRSLAHGEAVALDIIFSACLSYHRGMLSMLNLKKVVSLAKRMKLPVFHEYFCDHLLLWEALLDTTAHRNGNQNLPTPVTIGNSIFLNDVTLDDIICTSKIYYEITT
jgi:3-dehydroquinate synthase